MKVGILGGGLTGLILADMLLYESIVFEKESECGGLCKSMNMEGFTFDYGGSHIIFSKDEKVLNYLVSLLENNVDQKRRNTKILYKGAYIKYPFENGLADLPLQDNYECLKDYIQNVIQKSRNEVIKPSNFEEWMYFTFGKAITEKYLRPYNKKIWNYDPKMMNLDWVNGRIPEPPIDDIIKSSLGIDTEGYVHQLHFYYPITGGIQSIIKTLEKRNASRIKTNYEVKSIKRNKGGKWIVSNGIENFEFDKLISTIPLQEIFKCLTGVPTKVQDAINDLKYNSLITVMIGVNSPKLNDISWMYIPEDKIIFNRVSFPFNFSDEVVPKNKSSVLAEITCFGEDTIWSMNESQILEKVVNQLDETKIIDKKKVCFGTVKRFKYAYVIYDINYNKNIQIIIKYFEELGIHLIGRFSEFKYLNMDGCVKSVMSFIEDMDEGGNIELS